MKRLLIAATLVALCFSTRATVQADEGAAATTTQPSATEPLSTEMWFYREQLRRHDDPEQAVRRKAEQRAAERMARIAAMKWYGYSNARPTVNPTPWGATYSPTWSGNSVRQYNWNVYPRTVVVPVEGYNR